MTNLPILCTRPSSDMCSSVHPGINEKNEKEFHFQVDNNHGVQFNYHSAKCNANAFMTMDVITIETPPMRMMCNYSKNQIENENVKTYNQISLALRTAPDECVIYIISGQNILPI